MRKKIVFDEKKAIAILPQIVEALYWCQPNGTDELYIETVKLLKTINAKKTRVKSEFGESDITHYDEYERWMRENKSNRC